MDGTFNNCHFVPDDTFDIIAKVEECLKSTALSLATQITRLNRQAVVKRLFYDSDGKYKYMIIAGIPEKSDRHGLGEEGFLFEPVEKTALLEAVNSNDVVIIQDAYRDPRTQYMRVHVETKNIQSVAIIPIKYGNVVKYLIILDKVPPSQKGFTEGKEGEIEFLRQAKHRIETKVIPCAKAGTDTNLYVIFQQLLNGLLHETLNRLMSIGGFNNRTGNQLDKLISALGDGVDAQVKELLEKLQRNTATIKKESTLCEHNIKGFHDLARLILPTEEIEEMISAKHILGYFAEENYVLGSSDNGIEKSHIIAHPSKVDALFSQFKKYLAVRTNNGNGHKTLISTKKEGSFLEICLQNESFREVNTVLELFEYLVGTMNGWLRFHEDRCVIALPLYDE